MNCPISAESDEKEEIHPLGQGSAKMKPFKRIFIFIFIMVMLVLETDIMMAQGPYSILTGKVLAIREKRWLDVENEVDKTILNFRIGRKTVYIPHRYPNPQERVKVEYLIQKGTPVAYVVTLLEGSKVR